MSADIRADSHMSEREESLSLLSILGGEERSVARFFESAWQEACAIFVNSERLSENNDLSNEYEALISQGWDALVDLLEQARRSSERPPVLQDDPGDSSMPLLFQQQTLMDPEERTSLYGTSLFGAFLDGCSIVVNHADLQSPWIAALCQDLQKSFPHAYANTYLTPPGSQAVSAHADDRDVLVIQVVGAKHWKVYQRIPVPYPYPHEQVGKNGLPVPPFVVEGPVMIDRILRPGDVLYMPRGYVHEATAIDSDLSFHVTVALATHDWSLAGALHAAGKHVWERNLDYRRAIAREVGTCEWNEIDHSIKERLQKQIDEAVRALKEEMTVEAIHQSLKAKYARHNDRAGKERQTALARRRTMSLSQGITSGVGRRASECVSLTSHVRLATASEKASLPPTDQPRGLLVRQENHEAVMNVLQTLRESPDKLYSVRELRSVLATSSASKDSTLICDLTILCFARQCVELGALAVVISDENATA